jgi:hypothetical protein
VKVSREKCQVTYKGKPIRITADFSTEPLKEMKTGNDVLQALKEDNCQPRLLYPAKIAFIIEGEIKTFLDRKKKTKLREFTT